MANHGVFASVTGQKLDSRLWPTKGKPRAIVQIVHGMAEHIDRYDQTAQKLNAAGFAVVGHNHLGHGEAAKIKGFFAREHGWDNLIEDVHSLRLLTQREYPGVPYILLGHSMGSFVTRCYCQKYEKGLTGVILSGTGHFKKGMAQGGKLLAQILCALGMEKKPAALLQKVAMGGYLKSFPGEKNANAWLNRDPGEVAKYDNDSLCGFAFTAGGYRDLGDGMLRMLPHNLSTMKKDIPLFLIAGDMDPVGANGEGVKKVAQEFREAGINQVEVKLYPGARHEIFLETNREEVCNDVIRWIENLL